MHLRKLPDTDKLTLMNWQYICIAVYSIWFVTREIILASTSYIAYDVVKELRDSKLYQSTYIS